MMRRRAFSLVELLVVISIVSLLLALLLPALSKARQASRQVACLAQQRQLGVAWGSYDIDNDMVRPTGYLSLGGGMGFPSWHEFLLGDYLPAQGVERLTACTENKRDSHGDPAGTYGVYTLASLTATRDGEFGAIGSFSGSGTFQMIHTARAVRTTDLLYMACTTMGHPPGSAYSHNWEAGNKRFEAHNFVTYGGVWLIHSGAANGLFLDGHAATSTPASLTTLYNATYHNGSSRGIHAWVTADRVQVIQ